MGRSPSIDSETGERLIEAYQRLGSQRAAAAEVGVSVGSAQRFFESLPKAAAPVIAQQQQLVTVAGADLWDTRSALDENYQRLIRLVDIAQGATTSKEIQAYTGVLREIRSHIESGMDLAKLLVDIDEVRTFQQAVIEAIGEADERTKERIIAKLRQRRALGLAL